MRRIWILVSLFFLTENSALAEFSATNRSINGTGETLPDNVCEVGVRSLACAVNDDLMVVAPTLSIMTGMSDFEVRQKIYKDVVRVSGALIGGTPLHMGARVDVGYDFGQDKSHSVTLTLDSDWAARTKLPLKTYKPAYAYRFTHYLGGEYDYYHRGNVAYLGITKRVPYVGYTWAWESFFAGVILSPGKVMYPLPYVYWRF